MSTTLRPTLVKAPEIGALRAVRIGANNPSHVIVMLGEAGLSPDDLAATADVLISRAPGAAAVILGPAVFDPTWRLFSESGSDADAAAVKAALKAEGLSTDRLWSGATLVLAATTAGHLFVCALALACRLVGDLKACRAQSPDVCVSYGEHDAVMTPGKSQAAAETLSRRGYAVALVSAPHRRHEIAAEQLHQGASFLRGAIVERERVLLLQKGTGAGSSIASV